MNTILDTEDLMHVTNDINALSTYIDEDRRTNSMFNIFNPISAFFIKESELFIFKLELKETNVVISQIIICDITIENNQLFHKSFLVGGLLPVPKNILKRLTNLCFYDMTPFVIEKHKVSCKVYKKPFKEENCLIYINGLLIQTL